MFLEFDFYCQQHEILFISQTFLIGKLLLSGLGRAAVILRKDFTLFVGVIYYSSVYVKDLQGRTSLKTFSLFLENILFSRSMQTLEDSPKNNSLDIFHVGLTRQNYYGGKNNPIMPGSSKRSYVLK